MEHWWKDTDREKGSVQRKTCPISTSSTTSLTCTDPGSNSCLCGGRPENNSVSVAHPFVD